MIVNGIDLNNLTINQLYSVEFSFIGVQQKLTGYFTEYYGESPNRNNKQACFIGTKMPTTKDLDEFCVVTETFNNRNTEKKCIRFYNVYLSSINNIEELDWNIPDDMTIREYMESPSNAILKGGIKKKKSRSKSKSRSRSRRRGINKNINKNRNKNRSKRRGIIKNRSRSKSKKA